MEQTQPEKSTSVMPPEVQGAPTIGAKPINAKAVVSPIRVRFRSSQIVWYILGLIEILLVFRFVLKFIGANESAGFTQFIYTISFPFAGPFETILNASQVNASVFEWSLLIAMIVYALIAWGIVKLLVMSKPVSDQEAHSKLDSQE